MELTQDPEFRKQLTPETLFKTISSANNEIVKLWEQTSRVAEKGPVNMLLSLGGLLLILPFLLKLNLFGFTIADFGTGEFIASIFLGSVLLLAGSYLRFYQWKAVQEAGRDLRHSGVEIVKRGMDLGGEMIKQAAPDRPTL